MDVRNYTLVTAAYWGFTLSDGALRMLVLLYFHQLGYTPVSLAFLFLLYEFFGILTNLLGGWIGSRIGLRITLFAGLAIQVIALVMLSLVQPTWAASLSVAYVMASQALSGIAKDLTKMSSKSAVKLLVKADNTVESEAGTKAESDSALFKWVAILTGSKNALKGLGFLLGGVLLSWLGFAESLWAMAAVLTIILLCTAIMLDADMGRSKSKTKFTQLFAKSREINVLSIARFFLFSSRDVWFVVGLPIFLASQLQWGFAGVGAFLAAWVIGYGFVQAFAPRLVRKGGGVTTKARAAQAWGFTLVLVSAALALAIQTNFYATASILIGLAIFGVVFAVNSSVHSYLILAYTDSDQVAINVGFYYMANACGRLAGTLLSGVMYLYAGLPGCLWASTALVIGAAVSTLWLPTRPDADESSVNEAFEIVTQ
ncbi:Major Facilitator Superfamily protein [Novipirellula aureliae]|uniref:Major Facilitator Superfamily protein n=1 Tax=Novipirellula aureliae TaxID=2527966 RepID=A0A5C6EBD8_9BACT|nr:organoarsenical effux MFS transporter ArsJ [Novipirellula aureliae]TWU45081.1 Major Facilitator Superfamily protein [Novipirellula aureliae]